MIATAHSQIRPLSKIEAYVKMATDGFSVFKALLTFFLSMNIVWLCTSLPFFNHGKKIIYIVMTLGFTAEVVAIIYENELFEQLGEMNVIGLIRYWTRVCSIVIWFISCFTPCLYPYDESSDQYDSRLDDLLRNQMEFVSKLNAVQTEDILGSQTEVPKQPLTNTIRKYHPGTRRSRSAERRSSSKQFLPVITPSRPPIDISKLKSTSKTKHSSEPNTIMILKEMQRQHNDTDTEISSAEFPSSRIDYSSSTGATDDESTVEPPSNAAPQCLAQESRKIKSSKKLSRKRKRLSS